MKWEREGALPASFYGRRDILDRSTWKRLIYKYNPPELMESMDKLLQKERLTGSGITVPPTLLVAATEEDLEGFRTWTENNREGFVVKPSMGHGGAGILVVERRVASRFILPSGRGIGRDRIERHMGRIILGSYSGGIPDRAIVERRLVLSRRLRELTTIGLLDIRVVVFRGFPIMAMTRLPTKRSGGRANVHQGALAAGISVSEGRITSASIMRKNVRKHPRTGRNIIGFRFNMWEDILESASSAAEAMGMGFAGVDLTVDDDLGVVVIEVNRRPGLEIQNANRAGMRKRIQHVNRKIRKEGKELELIGPGLKVELARKWDSEGWSRHPVLEEE